MATIFKTLVFYQKSILYVFISQKTHLPSPNDTYFTMRRGNPTMGGGGKDYDIVRFPPGEKLLYSQFSGGKGYYGERLLYNTGSI